MAAGATNDSCRFCAIIRGDEPAHIILSDANAIAFLDVRPLFYGHTLLVPRQHIETLGDVPQDLLHPIFAGVQRLALAVEAAMEAEGTFVAINNRVSQSVPHLHIHIVPRRRGDGLRGFFWPRQKYRDEQHMREVAEAIREALRSVP